MMYKLLLYMKTKEAWLKRDGIGMPLGNFTIKSTWHKSMKSPAYFDNSTIEEVEIETEFGITIRTKNFELLDNEIPVIGDDNIMRIRAI